MVAVAPEALTRRQLATIEAYVRTGSLSATAGALGVAESTVRQHLADARRRTGATCAPQLVWRLLASGELAPPRVGRHREGGIGARENAPDRPGTRAVWRNSLYGFRE